VNASSFKWVWAAALASCGKKQRSSHSIGCSPYWATYLPTVRSLLTGYRSAVKPDHPGTLLQSNRSEPKQAVLLYLNDYFLLIT